LVEFDKSTNSIYIRLCIRRRRNCEVWWKLGWLELLPFVYVYYSLFSQKVSRTIVPRGT